MCLSSKIRAEPLAFTPSVVKNHDHIVVVHDYHDHSNELAPAFAPTVVDSCSARGGVATPFPFKLHEMLSRVEDDGFADIVSWQPHGRCFVVHKPKQFVEILPRYFALSKISSFQRQLNLYGFQRLTRGDDRGGYYHELFLRGMIHLAHRIPRVKVKGTGVRARSNPEQEPNFWSMPWVNESPSSQVCRVSSVVSLDNEVPSTESDDMRLDGWGKPFYYLDPITSSLPQEAVPLVSNDDDDLVDILVRDLDDAEGFENFLATLAV